MWLGAGDKRGGAASSSDATAPNCANPATNATRNSATVTWSQSRRAIASIDASAKLHALVHHDQRLAVVSSTEEQAERFGGFLQALHQVLSVFQSSRVHHGGQFALRLSETRRVVENDEALHSPSTRDQHRRVLDPAPRTSGVVLRDRPAENDPSVHRDVGEHGVENLSTHVVKVEINALGARLVESPTQMLLAIVQALVEGVRLHHLGALLRSPGGETEECGNARHAEHVHHGGEIETEPARYHGKTVLIVREDPLLPVRHSKDDVAHLVVRVARFDDEPGTAASDDFTQLNGRKVSRRVVHPRTNRGIDTQHGDFYQCLAIATDWLRGTHERRRGLND